MLKNSRIAILLLCSAQFLCAENLPVQITDPAESLAEGRALAQEILAQKPATNSTLSGVLKIRPANGARTEMAMRFEVRVSATNWMSIYEKFSPTNEQAICRLTIVHGGTNANGYQLTMPDAAAQAQSALVQSVSFGGDFSAMDFGLDFFHWPEQRLLRKEIHRTRSCKVLESINPQPATNGYSKVISWIDRETLGVLDAEAYDAHGKLLKTFSVKRFGKDLAGKWQLKEMEMRNEQTESRTQIEFKPDAE